MIQLSLLFHLIENLISKSLDKNTKQYYTIYNDNVKFIMIDLIDKNSIEYKARICLSLSMKPNSTLWAKHYWKSVAEQLLKKTITSKKIGRII